MKIQTRAAKYPPHEHESESEYRTRLTLFHAGSFTSAELEEAVRLHYPKHNVLVIPDIHCPADHIDAIPFLLDVKDRFQCDTVISIGDIVDFVSISFHPSMPNHPSPEEEIELAAEALQPWHDAFPNVQVAVGNHDARIVRKTRSANVPDILLRPLEEVLGIPSWTFHDSLEIDGVFYQHNMGSGINGAARFALKQQKPCVAGHVHSAMGVQYQTLGLWGMQVGTLIDFSNYRFDYAKGTASINQLGCGVVLEGKTPIAVPFRG